MSPGAEAILIEPARPDDAAAIAGLLREAGLPCEDFAAHLANFVVARHGDLVVGAVGFEFYGPDALLRSLVVAPARRRSGVASRLLGRVVETAGRAGVGRLYLLTTTAEEYFARRGFGRIAREKVPAAVAASGEFCGLCPDTAACLTRGL
jgi:amino-acid N-acetyltransferase